MNLLNKLTVRNLKLNKKRTIVTIVGIILSVALITAVASLYTSGRTKRARFTPYFTACRSRTSKRWKTIGGSIRST